MTNNPESHNSIDPNIAFGRDQAMFAYMVTASLGGDTTRTLSEAANAAVRTATRQFDRADVDIEIAALALVEQLTEGFESVIVEEG